MNAFILPPRTCTCVRVDNTQSLSAGAGQCQGADILLARPARDGPVRLQEEGQGRRQGVRRYYSMCRGPEKGMSLLPPPPPLSPRQAWTARSFPSPSMPAPTSVALSTSPSLLCSLCRPTRATAQSRATTVRLSPWRAGHHLQPQRQRLQRLRRGHPTRSLRRIQRPALLGPEAAAGHGVAAARYCQGRAERGVVGCPPGRFWRMRLRCSTRKGAEEMISHNVIGVSVAWTRRASYCETKDRDRRGAERSQHPCTNATLT